MSDKNLPTVKHGRLHGIDCLRLLSMLGVVTLHVLGHGGALAASQGATSAALWLAETACYPAVDVFVLMSGYLSSRRVTSHVKRAVLLWAQAVFYGAAVAVIGVALGRFRLNFNLALQVASPLSRRTWWFLSDFIAASLMFPLADAFVQRASRDDVRLVALTLFGTLSLVGTLSHFATSEDSFTLHLGYSSMWFVTLYALGSCMRQLEINRIKPSHLMAMAALCTVLTWWWKLWCGPAASTLFGADVSDVLLAYTSPTVLIPAICLVASFAQITIASKLARFALQGLSPLAFGVYLLSDHPMIREWFVTGRFASLAEHGPLGALARVAVTVLAIFAVGIAVDWLRARLFDLAGTAAQNVTLGDTPLG